MNWWNRRALQTPPDDSSYDRQKLLAEESAKLRRAQSLAAQMDAHDQINNYAKRLRTAYALVVAQEGNQ